LVDWRTAREIFLARLLPDDVVVEHGLDLDPASATGARPKLSRLLLDLLGDDVVTEADALVADVDRRPPR